MIRKKKSGIEWLEFSLFSAFPELVHGVFFKQEGHSWVSFDKENSNAESAKESIRKLLDCEKIFLPHQIHGVQCVDVYRHFECDLVCDALMTNENSVGLGILHADCQAAIIYDPCHKVIATVHAGWRGMVAGIYGKTISALGERYGTRPADLLVAIGPSLGPQHAEFIHYRTEFPKSFWPFRKGEYTFDLWKIALWQLEQAGVLEKRVELAERCTYGDNEKFFSYRRDKTKGRHATVVALRSSCSG